MFRSTEKTTIPGQNYQNGKLVAGEVVINVVADQPGQEYNIDPSTFSIPGFASTEKYTAFYGKSFENMTGGFSGEVLQVTEKDLEDAKNTLTNIAFGENVNTLKNKLVLDYVFLEDNLSQEITEVNSSVKAGDEVNSFTLQIKANSKIIAFRKSDLESFIKESLLAKVPNGKKIWEESLKTDFKSESINWENGKLILSVDSSAKTYSDIDQNSLIEALRGRSSKEAEMILGIQPQIAKSKINFWLFKLGNLPKDSKRIQVILRLSDLTNYSKPLK